MYGRRALKPVDQGSSRATAVLRSPVNQEQVRPSAVTATATSDNLGTWSPCHLVTLPAVLDVILRRFQVVLINIITACFVYSTRLSNSSCSSHLGAPSPLAAPNLLGPAADVHLYPHSHANNIHTLVATESFAVVAAVTGVFVAAHMSTASHCSCWSLDDILRRPDLDA